MTRSPGALDARLEHSGITIERPRLAKRIDDALATGSVMLTAGPGYGKTTAVVQALAARRLPTAWVTCSFAERDAGTLLRRIVTAVAAAAPGTTDVLAERLAGGLEPIDARAETRNLISELSRLLLEPVVVVIDDAEQIAGASGSIGLIGELIRAELPMLHLAIATRQPLELRVAKPRAAGRFVELQAADLAFDVEECAEVVGSVTGGEPKPEHVEAMMQATEGWPLGVVLSSRQLERGPGVGPPNLSSTPELRAYLAEELLESLESELREQAISASVARRLTPAVLQALELPDDFRERAERSGLLIQAADAGGFSFHPLLREFLLERLQGERGEEDVRELHAAVASAVAAEDSIEGIEHWLGAEDWPGAAAAIEGEGLTRLRTSPALVRGWLEKLPAAIRARPGLQALEGHLDWVAGDNARAITELRDAIRGFREDPNPPADWLTRSILADALFATGGVEEVYEVVDGWDRPEAEGAGALAPAAVAYAAVVMAANARLEESDRLAEAAASHPQAAFLEPLEALRLAFRDSPAGHQDEVLRLLHEADQQAERFDPLRRRAHILGAIAATTWDVGRAEEALELWLQVRNLPELPPVLYDASHAWCALIYAEAGRLAEAEAELALHKAEETGYRAFIADLAPAVVASLRGDVERTLSWADRALASVEGGPIVFRCWVAANLVPSLAAVGHAARAWAVLEDALDELDEALPGAHGRALRARLLGLRAWLHHEQGQAELGDQDLSAFLGEAADAARLSMRREWDRLEPVIWDALERGAIDPASTVGAIGVAFPEGLQLVAFLDHPSAEVRRAALEPAVRSGDPEAVAKLRKLADDPDADLAAAAGGALDRLGAALPPIGFDVLGGFAVRRGSWRAGESDWARPIDARLVRFLLVNAGQPIPEDLIFEALWPGRAASGARRSLQVAVSRARQVLDPPGSAGSAIESGGQSYRLAIDEDQVDANRFSVAAEAALRRDPGERLPLLDRARSLWAGEPLPEERYADWAASYRERLIDQYIAVLTGLCRLHEAGGDHLEAAQAARELVALDPLNEDGHRALMIAYSRTGRRGHALRQYLECRRALVDALGVEPAEETSLLQGRILAGEPV